MSLGPAGAQLNPEEADNFEDIEKQFAVKVVAHMQTYWSILEKIPGSKLRLTKMDDDIYEHFKREFPDFDPKETIDEDKMKSKEGKERWRDFINQYEKKVEDFNFGTMLRANPAWEYGEKETIFAVRMQFYAIEIVRRSTEERKSKEDEEDDSLDDEAEKGKQPIDTTDEDIQRAPWKALFYFTTKPHLVPLSLGILASIVSGLASPAQAILIGRAFQQFSSYATGALTGTELLTKETEYVFYLLGLGCVGWIVEFFFFGFWLAFGELQAKSARDRLFTGLLERDIECQIRELQLSTSQPLGALICDVATTILNLAVAFRYSWKLTLVVISTTPVIGVTVAFLGARMQKNLNKQREKQSEALKYVQSALNSIETVKCYNGQETEKRKYSSVVEGVARWYYRVAQTNSLQFMVSAFMGQAMFVQGFYYGSKLAFNSITGILPQMIVLEKGKTAGATLRAIMAQVQMGPTVSRRTDLKEPEACQGNIAVENVGIVKCLKLTATDRVTAFFRVSFETGSDGTSKRQHVYTWGELSFIIGKSGSGKSTMNQLLLRFYRPALGKIELDGVPITALDDRCLPQHRPWQEDFHRVTRAEAMEAAEFALLQLMINDMPEGLDTMVELKGGSMSGGQKQRMALARARLRDTPILILDESTSALDHISRSLMMDAIRQWRKGKTTIIITHDIEQILPEDYVYIFENTRLVQEGYRNHMEKMKDTPFQHFLPENEQSEDSPRDKWRHTSADFTAREESTSFYGAHVNINTASTVHSTYNFGGFGGTYGSPFLRLAGSPHSPDSPRSTGEFLSPFRKSRTPEQLDPNFRWSRGGIELMDKFLDRSGSIAANARTGMSRRMRHRPKSEGTIPDTKKLHGRTSKRKPRRTKGTSAPDNIRTPLPLKAIFRTIWPSLDWRERVSLSVGFTAAAAHAACTPVFSSILSKLVQTMGMPNAQHKATQYSLTILGLAFFDAVSMYLMHLCLEYAGEKWIDHVRVTAMERILDQPKNFFLREENGVSQISEALDRHAEEMRNLLGRFAGFAFVGVIMMAISLVWALIVQWKLTLCIVSVGPYVWFVTKAFGAISGKWEGKANSASEAAGAIFMETFTTIKTVRALTLETHFTEKYRAVTKTVLRIGFKRSFYTGFFFGMSSSSATFVKALVFYVGAKLVKDGAAIGPVIQVFTQLTMTILQVTMILSLIPQINMAQDTASRILRLSQLPHDSHEHAGNTRIPSVGDIILTDLMFYYPSRPDQTILQNINLTVRAGTCTAIVGSSGSGKSTIASLLLNLYTTPRDMQSLGELPEIVISGRDMKHIHTPTLRSLITVVPQTPTLFAATIEENILYGLPDTSPYRNLAAAREAASAAGIDAFIMTLPQGYETLVGEGGTSLSGGQAQRVAIARALVRQPGVLVLDEATSALDVESASLIRNTIQSLVRDGRRRLTVIIITHAREMMAIADTVVVLDHGRMVETGGFQELLERKGSFIAC
ncbi:ATP-dependent permease [Taxawa tesnikishii (nom. ined.)]|nr:ATP-dependent permease [Dothideales sp. JES 119]